MAAPKITDVKKGISLLWETLQCPICLELMTAPVSTNCDHQFCKFCMTKLLDNSKQNRACCPVCKAKITRRSLQESPGFQRLVAGLQDMILAYEHDTGTNYFTGLSWPFKDTNDKQAEPAHDSGDTRDTDLDKEKHTDLDILPLSHSSTIAAQNGFARLMGFEHSAPLLTENEGLDSGLGDAPLTSDRRLSSPADEPEPAQADVSCDVKEATSTHKRGFVECPSLSPFPDETKHYSPRKSSKKKKSKILQQRKKKSLEKVAEWLMKVPTDGTVELDEPGKKEDDSDSCSSTSTIDIKQHIKDMTGKRGDQAKALEDQVFGAVYKRRSSKIPPALPDSLAEPSIYTETQAESASIISTENCLSPADYTSQEQQEVAEATNDASSDFFTEVRERNDACAEEFNKPWSDENKDKPDSVSGARTRKRTRSALLQVDSDLKEQTCAESEAPEQKKPDKRMGKLSKLAKSKPGRVPKPLVLVEVQKGGSSPKPRGRAKDSRLQIESYSSSEGQEASAMKSTRKSRRLQVFAEEVQGRRETASLRGKVSGKNRSVTKQHKEVQSEALGDTTQLRNGNKMGATKRNGCVYFEDIAGIENLSKPAEANNCCVGTMSNGDPLPEVSPACSVSVVPNSTSTNNADVVEPTLPSHKPADHSPSKTRLEASVCEDEEEQNDCEADTEQLLKSFKATKRKSFHLGGADVKKSCYSDKDKEKEENRQESARLSQSNLEFLRETGKSTCSDLISPSFSPIQNKKTVSKEADQVMVVDALIADSSCSTPISPSADCRNSLSSVLPPNQVAKSDLDSPHVSVVPQVVSSGLHFTAVEHEDVDQTSKCSQVAESQLSCEVKLDGKVKQKGDEISSAQHSADAAEHVLNTEFSLTPDGLIPLDVQNVQEASGEISTPSSIPISKKRKRRVQTLQSSSGSDTSGPKEDLPTLAQIFGIAACPPAGCQDPVEGPASEGACDTAEVGELLNLPSRCPSPDCIGPSQGSVDLFGTPDDCEVPVNNVEVSMEPSQFSSEVLVTQQKIEMQQELVRLEKLMALVTEVLQEKEGSPSSHVPPESRQCDGAADPEPQRFPQCSRDAGRVSDRNDVREARGDVHPGPSGVGKVAEQTQPKPDGITGRGSAKGPGVSKTLDSKTLKSSASPCDGQENKENNSPPKDGPKAKLVLVSSGLGPGEQVMVKKFARTIGARVVSRVTPEVTHIVMSTDEQLVCERTLKYFLGIAGRKWVVSIRWISECFKQKKLLDESLFEVRGDVVNGANHQGPSRARATGDGDLLMKGYRICFQGSFTDMTTDELEWMVELCGADVVKDPLLFDGKQKSHQLLIVQHRPESLASTTYLSRHATVVTRSWLLDSVSTYSLQNVDCYAT